MLHCVFNFIDNFRMKSFVEDLRPGFLGHSIMTFTWNRPYDRELHIAYENQYLCSVDLHTCICVVCIYMYVHICLCVGRCCTYKQLA